MKKTVFGIFGILAIALLLFGCVQPSVAPTPTPTPTVTPSPTPTAPTVAPTPTPGVAEVEQEASEIEKLIQEISAVGEIENASEAGELVASIE